MSTNPAQMGRQTGLVDRISDMQGKANTPMTCPRCGGTWFYKVSAEQFSNEGYGSAQYRSLTMTTETSYICLCGCIVENKESVGRGAESRHGQFLNAIRTALDSQKRNSIQIVASTCASIDEVQQLRQRVEWLESAITSFTTDQTPIEAEPMTAHVDDHEELPQHVPIEADVAYSLPTSTIAPVAPGEMISKPAVRTGRRPKE